MVGAGVAVAVGSGDGLPVDVGELVGVIEGLGVVAPELEGTGVGVCAADWGMTSLAAAPRLVVDAEVPESGWPSRASAPVIAARATTAPARTPAKRVLVRPGRGIAGITDIGSVAAAERVGIVMAVVFALGSRWWPARRKEWA